MVDIRTELERRQRKTNLDADMIARDMLQARILSAMFDDAAKRELALKGGLAMRAAHGSHRFTKDIDLQSGPDTPMPRVKAIVENAVKTALKAGILENATISAPKQTETVQRWKVNGTIVGGGSLVNLTVEVSRRGMPAPKALSTITYAPAEEGVKAVSMEVYSPQAIAASKVDCLLNPNRVAPRDVYDLYQLIVSMRVDPPVEYLRRLGKDAIAIGMEEVLNKIAGMTWDLARDDLKPYLSMDGQPELTESSWDDMRERTAEMVDGWLKATLQSLDEEENNAPRGP